MSSVIRREKRKCRHRHIRKKVRGTIERPRLSIFRSAKHFYAQVIDDISGQTIACVSTLDKEFRDRKIKSSTREGAQVLGEILAQRCLKNNVKQLAFDRGGFKYHGRVAAFADSIREKSIEM